MRPRCAHAPSARASPAASVCQVEMLSSELALGLLAAADRFGVGRLGTLCAFKLEEALDVDNVCVVSWDPRSGIRDPGSES